MTFLPPAYVVRREGNVLTRVCPSICLSTGGYPYPIMLCNITQNAMGQTPVGGYPYPIMLCNITQNTTGQTPGGTQPGPAGGGYPARGYPCRVPPPPVRTGGTLPGLGGYPGRITEGVLTTRWAVCLLRSRRRTFLLTL